MDGEEDGMADGSGAMVGTVCQCLSLALLPVIGSEETGKKRGCWRGRFVGWQPFHRFFNWWSIDSIAPIGLEQTVNGCRLVNNDGQLRSG